MDDKTIKSIEQQVIKTYQASGLSMSEIISSLKNLLATAQWAEHANE